MLYRGVYVYIYTAKKGGNFEAGKLRSYIGTGGPTPRTLVNGTNGGKESFGKKLRLVIAFIPFSYVGFILLYSEIRLRNASIYTSANCRPLSEKLRDYTQRACAIIRRSVSFSFAKRDALHKYKQASK